MLFAFALTATRQVHASNVSCLSFRPVVQCIGDGGEAATATSQPLLLASGGADHCVRIHSIALQC
jgi:hypothetical protein